VIAKISAAAWGGGSGGIVMRHTNRADRTSSRKRSFLVDADAGTYIGHPRTWVRRMREEGEVVASRMGWWDVPCPRPRQGRNMRADAFAARRGVDREAEMTYWKLEKNVSGEETEGKTWAGRGGRGGGEGET
jgi:hypothetical protein